MPNHNTLSATALQLLLNYSNNIEYITNLEGCNASSATLMQTSITGQTATTLQAPLKLKGLTFSCRHSYLYFNGMAGQQTSLEFVRLLNTKTGQWTSTSAPQISLQYNKLGYTALVNLFNDLAAQGTVTSKTINITGNPGTASLTASDKLIITSKGWTITGA